jgi:uncharacterized protein YndB with AHSA1/START domain
MQTIAISTIISAPIDKVWDYYTKPEHITHWNFASDDWCCPRATNDLRPGGSFSSRMEARDGSVVFDFEGIYDVVQNLQHIKYHMSDGRQVDTAFSESDGKTTVATIFDAENENTLELQQNGWQSILNNFKSYVEKS